MKILKSIGIVFALVIGVIAILYLLRSDPIGPISGKALSGVDAPYPSNWEACNEQDTLAIESRPQNPHSVTTWCFLYNGDLYIPASKGGEKDWPKFITEDPRVRIKLDGVVYPAMATRVTNVSLQAIERAITTKYAKDLNLDDFAQNEGAMSELRKDVWLFRISRR